MKTYFEGIVFKTLYTLTQFIHSRTALRLWRKRNFLSNERSSINKLQQTKCHWRHIESMPAKDRNHRRLPFNFVLEVLISTIWANYNL